MSRLTRIAATMLEQDIGAPPIPPQEDDWDDDADDEEWNYDSLQRRFGIKASEWADTSPNAQKIRNLIRDKVFSTRPAVKVTHVNFPHGSSFGSAQVEWEWLVGDPGQELDDQIKAILKRSSDLTKVFGVVSEQVWNVVDKGDVDEFLRWVVTTNYTTDFGKPKGKNTLKSDVGFKWYEMMEANRAKYEKNLTTAIFRRMPKQTVQWFKSKGITTPEVKFEEPNKKNLHLFGREYDDGWWGKAILMWMFSFPQASEPENKKSFRTFFR